MTTQNLISEAISEYYSDPNVQFENLINFYMDENLITEILMEQELENEEVEATEEGLIDMQLDLDDEELDALIIELHNLNCQFR